jgi:hypothetical protein
LKRQSSSDTGDDGSAEGDEEGTSSFMGGISV